MDKPTILLLYSNQASRSLLQTALQDNDFNVEAFGLDEDVDQLVTRLNFDLILIDFGVTQLLDCFVLIEHLKENPISAPLPILVVDRKDSVFRSEIYKKGALGVVSGAYGSEELIHLIKAILFQIEILKPKNSISGLPSGPLVEMEINRRIDRQESMAVICIAINQAKFFREKYGLDLLDELVRELALIIKMTIHHQGAEDDFIGQLDFNNFIIITRPEKAEIICQEIIDVFEKDFMLLHYNAEDQKAGYMNHISRQGKALKIPLISLAIGISHNEKRAFTGYNQVISLARELQRKALTYDQSIFFKDQRTS